MLIGFGVGIDGGGGLVKVVELEWYEWGMEGWIGKGGGVGADIVKGGVVGGEFWWLSNEFWGGKLRLDPNSTFD